MLKCSNLTLKSLRTGDSTRADVNPTEPLPENSKGKIGQGWYAKLSDEKKAAYLEKLRISRQQKKAAALCSNVAKLGATSPLVSPGMANSNFIT